MRMNKTIYNLMGHYLYYLLDKHEWKIEYQMLYACVCLWWLERELRNYFQSNSSLGRIKHWEQSAQSSYMSSSFLTVQKVLISPFEHSIFAWVKVIMLCICQIFPQKILLYTRKVTNKIRIFLESSEVKGHYYPRNIPCSFLSILWGF